MTFSRIQPTDLPADFSVRCVFRVLLALVAATVCGCGTPTPPPPTAHEQATPVVATLTTPPPVEQAATPSATEKPAEAIADENNIFFAPGSTSVDEAGSEKLRQYADRLKQNPKERVTLRGYSDELGSRSVSLAITEQRLTAVGKALRAYGVAARQIRRNRVAGVKKPVSCSSPGCRKPMGRVELVYLP